MQLPTKSCTTLSRVSWSTVIVEYLLGCTSASPPLISCLSAMGTNLTDFYRSIVVWTKWGYLSREGRSVSPHRKPLLSLPAAWSKACTQRENSAPKAPSWLNLKDAQLTVFSMLNWIVFFLNNISGQRYILFKGCPWLCGLSGHAAPCSCTSPLVMLVFIAPVCLSEDLCLRSVGCQNSNLCLEFQLTLTWQPLALHWISPHWK